MPTKPHSPSHTANLLEEKISSFSDDPPRPVLRVANVAPMTTSADILELLPEHVLASRHKNAVSIHFIWDPEHGRHRFYVFLELINESVVDEVTAKLQGVKTTSAREWTVYPSSQAELLAELFPTSSRWWAYDSVNQRQDARNAMPEIYAAVRAAQNGGWSRQRIAIAQERSHVVLASMIAKVRLIGISS